MTIREILIRRINEMIASTPYRGWKSVLVEVPKVADRVEYGTDFGSKLGTTAKDYEDRYAVIGDALIRVDQINWSEVPNAQLVAAFEQVCRQFNKQM